MLNERLKRLRKELSLNQKELGDKIKLSQTHISSLENGAREMTDRIVYDICRELNVNEEWLRSGQGEMFVENDSTIIAELANEYHLNPIDQKIIEYYVKLDERSRKKIKEHVISLAEQINNLEGTAAAVELTPEQIAEEEAEAYRQEVLAELKSKKLSVSDEQKGKSS